MTFPKIETLAPNLTRLNLPAPSPVVAVWYSYQTPIMFTTAAGNSYVIKNYWSTTTGKHLNQLHFGPKSERLTQEQFDAAYRAAMGE